jgi:catechol 2,3-dioxygenase-like lactoylglutathione lyase family enzyme
LRDTVVTLGAPSPVLQATQVGRSVAFFRSQLGFELSYSQGDEFAILRRDAATVHVTAATDETWRERTDWSRPIFSGAESFLAGTGSCRIEVEEGIDDLYSGCAEAGIVHPRGELNDTWWGTREFAVLDPDGNLVALWEQR